MFPKFRSISEIGVRGTNTSTVTHRSGESILNTHVHEFMPSPGLRRRPLELHQSWIEATLGVALSEAIILEADLDLAQIAIERILACPSRPDSTNRAARSLSPLLASADIPPGFPPLLELKEHASDTESGLGSNGLQSGRYFNLEWQDCPVALRLHRIASPVIALNAYYHSGPGSDCERVSHLLITKRDYTAEVVRLVEELDRRDAQPQLHVLHGSTLPVTRCDWEQLVLDPNALLLLKNDFESFFERVSWFREKHLPFRRGYLLHGPPGNGKTTAIRAMMSSRGLSAYTMRLFGKDQEDRELEQLFDRALSNRPALVVFEDLDRAFPKTGETRSGISVQQLLNCLDGVATGEGIIVVATANEPAILDPAILRRPGRFDRVVHFPNPSSDLRREYFRRTNPTFSARVLNELAAKSSGFSFAQLREAYIMAGQRAFETKDEIKPEDVLSGITSLRHSIVVASKRNNPAGFRNVSSSEVAV
jgi:hypothetical protein